MTKGQTPKLNDMPDIESFKKYMRGRLAKIKKIEEYDKTLSKELAKKGRAATRRLEAKMQKLERVQAGEIAHDYVKIGIPGFDVLTEKGVPKGATVLVAGGAGTGKTIFCLQTAVNAAMNGERCLYISFEESIERLKQHMEDFGWDWRKLEKKGLLRLVKEDPFEISTSVEAMLAEARGELMIDIQDAISIFPEDFKPERVFIDSLSAIGAAFGGKVEEYRIYIEQLFEYFRKTGPTTFLISETEQLPSAYSRSGVEEFLADGIIVLYNIRQADTRTTAVEVLKMRGAKIRKKIAPFQVISGKGIEVYPEETVFTELK